ncbi:hypothetical protein GCM10023169_39090 [Georgenia halophila]|uniref:HEAT repeat domain-containing protein n=1 Tax=Georgenia halophila TaxID=620889 RepID=A0ABP8LN05_9MICO
MSWIARLRSLLSRQTPATRVGTRRPSAVERTDDVVREDELRAKLISDPNDIEAFKALAELVRSHAAGAAPADPLTADHHVEAKDRAADLAVWSLAEEIAGNSRAWYALVELARLSLHDDREGAMRRLGGACERDTTGAALAESVRMLREEDLPGEGFGLGVGHWNAKEHVVEAGVQVIRAALEAHRPAEARRLLDAMTAERHDAAATAAAAELEPEVAAAEAGSNA